MKHKFGLLSVLLALMLVFSLGLVACGGTTQVEVEATAETAPVEEEAAPVEEEAAPAEEAAPTEEPAPVEEEAAPTEEAAAPAEEVADPNELPRNETLYSNGQQWGAVVGWNPYSNSNNNARCV